MADLTATQAASTSSALTRSSLAHTAERKAWSGVWCERLPQPNVREATVIQSGKCETCWETTGSNDANPDCDSLVGVQPPGSCLVVSATLANTACGNHRPVRGHVAPLCQMIQTAQRRSERPLTTPAPVTRSCWRRRSRCWTVQTDAFAFASGMASQKGLPPRRTQVRLPLRPAAIVPRALRSVRLAWCLRHDANVSVL
jgi:hypothetical protein